MTFQEYIDAVCSRLDLPERVIARIRKEMEEDLFASAESGMSPEEAIRQMGTVAEKADELNRKYADTKPVEKEQGEMPLLLPWYIICSAALFFFKGIEVVKGTASSLDIAVCAVGGVLLVISILQALKYKKKK